MAIAVRCANPKCGKEIVVAAELAGKTVQCDACGQAIQIPVPDETKTVPITPKSVQPPVQSAIRTPQSAIQDSLIGAKIAHYQIESVLGQGGMGKVYKAFDTGLAKPCAIKILPQEFARQDRTYIDRFVREARSAAAVEHPNVLPVHFVGKVDENYFIEMQYVDGGTLQEVLKQKGRLEVKEAARIIRDAAAGLQAAHEKGIIHRDMKPTNIMLTSKGHVYVMDFGLAKLVQAHTALTQQGFILGTPLYMAPEQATGEAVDHRSDIYSLGVVFYQLLTGNPPYTADSPMGLFYKHQHAPIPDIAQTMPEVPAHIADVVRKMMAKRPADRYQSCAEIVQELSGFLTTGGPTLTVSEETLKDAPDHRKSVLTRAKRGAPSRPPGAMPSGATQKPGFFKKPGFLGLIAGAIGIVALLLIAGVYLLSRSRTTKPAPLVIASGALDATKQSHAVETPSAESAGKSAWDDVYVATAATGDKIPHPLSRKTHKQSFADGTTIDVPEAMVFIPGGKFIMGDNAEPTRSPAHEVDVKAFFMDKYEVTNAQYMEFVKATWHVPPKHISANGGKIPAGRENHPVTYVTWEDAKAYCDWCGKRLPTEAEWEKAASWDSIQGRKNCYPWGGKVDDDPAHPRANWAATVGCKSTRSDEWEIWWAAFQKTPAYQEMARLGGGTTPVGTFKGDICAYACYDMGGNVSEWVADWFDRYPGNTEMPPEPAAKCGQKTRVLRGGCWYQPSGSLACVIRGGYEPGTCSYGVGFRCAADYPWNPKDVGAQHAAPLQQSAVAPLQQSAVAPLPGQEQKSAWDDVYIATAATGEKIPHPLSRKTYKQTLANGTTIDVPEGMVYVPAGEFTMGVGNKPPDGPAHPVYLDGYCIGKYEVTNAEWEAFVNISGFEPKPNHWKDGRIPPGKENHPVASVSQEEARKYCEWLSSMAGRDVRLPTEAQWEKAARGPNAFMYPWGNDWDPNLTNNCWHLAEFGFVPAEGDDWKRNTAAWRKTEKGKEIYASGGNTSPVGSFPKGKCFYGCYDMAGNVIEWCSDWYKLNYYTLESARNNPQGPSEQEADTVDVSEGKKGKAVLVRGGGWNSTSRQSRTTYRHRLSPTVRGTDQGFRIVVVPRAEPEGAGAAPAEKKSASSAKSAESPPKADDRSADRAFDAVYITTAATGEKIPHPLSRKSSPITVAGKTVAVPEGMVYVPAGEFTMGEDNNPPKSPAHTVNVQAFFMAKYEVTNAEYLEFVKATWHTMPEHWLKNGGKIPPGRENHPVVFVSWEDAKAYCDWCGKRLPTEAEWEKAASWDSIKKRKNGYPWGSKPDSDPNRPLSNWAARLGCKSTLTEDWEAWWTGFKKTPEYTRLAELGGGTTPVGTFKAGVSVNGCYDMGGNVSEWVQDWFDKYPGAKELPAEWEADCGRKKRVYRDGTWYSPAGSAACVIRGRAGVSYVTYTLGFRCAADCPWKLETQSRDRKGRSSEVVCRSSEVAK